METNASPSGPTRRGFLDWFLVLCGSITGIAASVPALIYLWPVTKKGRGTGRKAVQGAENLGPWESLTDTLGGQPVIVLRTGDEYVAYSATCTHLGCIVHWDGQQKSFICPCHAAKFSSDGEVVEGPPPAPLRTYKVSVAGGKVYISES